MKRAVIDLHNDLLSFLTDKPGRSFEDPLSRSSYSLLKKGEVQGQVLALFATTGNGSVSKVSGQIAMFGELLKKHPLHFAKYSSARADSAVIQILPAFENASGFAKEDEPLVKAVERLEEFRRQLGPICYISLTWNEENRFGGGNMTNVGLKEDGKRLIEWMQGQRIALDLSHTSDKLAYESLDFIGKEGLSVPVMASHSNFRAVCNSPRNLPEEIAKEIIRRQGIIGINLFAPFIHQSDPMALLRHVEYGLDLGGENALSFGADFFCDADYPALVKKYQREEAFYPEIADVSVYPKLLSLFGERLGLKEEQLCKIGCGNAHRFIESNII